MEESCRRNGDEILDVNWIKLLGRRKPGSPCRSKRVQEALDKPDEGFPELRRGPKRKVWERPPNCVLLAERCNSLWRLYYCDREYLMVIGETIRDPTEVRYLAREEGDRIVDTRAARGRGFHRHTQSYGFSTMLIDYLRGKGRSLWVRGKEWPLDNFETFSKMSPGAHEIQYMVPRSYIEKI